MSKESEKVSWSVHTRKAVPASGLVAELTAAVGSGHGYPMSLFEMAEKLARAVGENGVFHASISGDGDIELVDGRIVSRVTISVDQYEG